MHTNSQSHTLSVVIPCLNEERYIETCILSILDNGFPQELMEILLIDGGSTDSTLEKINSLTKIYPQVRVIHNDHKKTPFALNLGINNASHDYILIASAHSSFDPGYIVTLFREMEEYKVDVIGGQMETKVKQLTPTSKAIREVLSNKFGVGNATFRTGIEQPKEVDTVPFGLYKTSLLKEVGGYNVRLIRNHDIELSKRLLKLNKRILLTPSTKCYYYARETYKSLAQNNYRNGKWNLLTVFITRDFKSLSLRHFVPLCFVVSIIFPAIASVFYRPFGYISLFIIILYFFSLIVIIFKTTSLKNTSFFHVLFAFFTLHFSYGIGSIVGFSGFFKKS